MTTDQLAILCIIGAVAVVALALLGFTKLAWILAIANAAAIFIIKRKN